MKYKTLFRLLLKVVGVMLIGQTITQAFHELAFNLEFMASPKSFWYRVLDFVGIAVQIALGLYLFFGGKWIVNKAIPGNRPYCHECGYDLTGAVDHRCAECGTPFRLEGVRPPTSAGSN